MASVIQMEETVLIKSGEWFPLDQYLLHPYLVQHPRRVEELLRSVPLAKRGIQVTWSMSHGYCRLEHIGLWRRSDPLAEIFIWDALFPGLERPLVPWWLTGKLEVKRNYFDDRKRIIHFHHGRLADPPPKEEMCAEELSRNEVRRHWWHMEFDEWPLYGRMVILPLVLLLAPFAYIAMLRQDLKGFRNIKPFFLLYIPVLLLLLPIWFLFPKTLRFFQPFLDPVTNALKVSRLVEEAFEQAPVRP